MKIKALWITCAEYSHCGETEGEHMMRDHCWGCAPFWWKVPVCPTDQKKLNVSGYCKECKKFYDLKKESRKCLRCDDILEEGDDLICGYHHLKS